MARFIVVATILSVVEGVLCGFAMGIGLYTETAIKDAVKVGLIVVFSLALAVPIFRIGIYTINDIVRFLGEPEAVQVMHSRIFTERPTADNAQLNIMFKNGAIASVFASLCVDDREFWKASLVMNFENGTVYRNAGPMSDRAIHSDMAVVYRVGEKEKGVERVRLEGRSGEYQWEIFHRAVRGEKLEGEVTPEEIVAGLRIIKTMRRAEVSGKTEAI